MTHIKAAEKVFLPL